MSSGPSSAAPELDVDGPAAPPRDNGELAFTAPWQARTFGVTMALVDAGELGWAQFRTALVTEIAVAEVEVDGDANLFDYWACWARALEQVLDTLELLGGSTVEERAANLAERPDGHDHAPGSGHGHGRAHGR